MRRTSDRSGNPPEPEAAPEIEAQSAVPKIGAGLSAGEFFGMAPKKTSEINSRGFILF